MNAAGRAPRLGDLPVPRGRLRDRCIRAPCACGRRARGRRWGGGSSGSTRPASGCRRASSGRRRRRGRGGVRRRVGRDGHAVGRARPRRWGGRASGAHTSAVAAAPVAPPTVQAAWPDGLRDLIASIAAGRSLAQALNALAASGPAPLRGRVRRGFPISARMLGTVPALEVVKEELADPTSDRVIEVLILAQQRGGQIVRDDPRGSRRRDDA